MDNKQIREKKTKNFQISLIWFMVIVIIVLGTLFYVKFLLPDYLLNQGKKYYEIKDYPKALNMFNMASEARPENPEPIYYKALTLSNLEPTYENQKELYDIAQLDGFDEASEAAEQSLANMRKTIEERIGSSYIDNVLYEDQLLRWNNSEPITYNISSGIEVPQEYYHAVRNAFLEWQTATNGELAFKEVNNERSAKINVNFTNLISDRYGNNQNITAVATPSVSNETLVKTEIKIKQTDNNGNYYDGNKIGKIALHEIGHALGLWGHSADENDIMHYSGDSYDLINPDKQITQRDLNTLMLVYKMIPDVTDKPLTQDQYKNMFYHNILTMYPGENFEMELQRLISEIQNDRQNIIAWVDLAIKYAYKRQYERSNRILYKILPLVTTDIQNQHVILYNLAANLYKMRRYNESEKYLTLAMSINDDFDTQVLEVFLDYRLGRLKIAKEKLILLNRLHPDHIDIALKLADIYTSEKNKAEVKNIINNLIKNNPKAIKDRRVQKYKNVKKVAFGV